MIWIPWCDYSIGTLFRFTNDIVSVGASMSVAVYSLYNVLLWAMEGHLHSCVRINIKF